MLDALYKFEPMLCDRLNPMLCDRLNEYLVDSMFGPYEHIGSAVFHLLRLQRKGKTVKAQQLYDLLSAFAEAHHA